MIEIKQGIETIIETIIDTSIACFEMKRSDWLRNTNVELPMTPEPATQPIIFEFSTLNGSGNDDQFRANVELAKNSIADSLTSVKHLIDSSNQTEISLKNRRVCSSLYVNNSYLVAIDRNYQDYCSIGYS